LLISGCNMVQSKGKKCQPFVIGRQRRTMTKKAGNNLINTVMVFILLIYRQEKLAWPPRSNNGLYLNYNIAL
jgi:hypothetical protein